MVRLWRALFWLACAVVVVLSLIPGTHLPSGLFDWWDKAQHTLAFFVIAGLGLLAYGGSKGRVVVGLLFFGVAIEVAQSATGWRYGDWQDWLADVLGVVAAYGCVTALRYRGWAVRAR